MYYYQKMKTVLIDQISRAKQFIFILIVLLFPLNQQLHIRPFPSVDGFIIDYLMTKVSVIEILLIAFTLLNSFNILKSFRNLELGYKEISISLFALIFLLSSIFRSNYILTAIYDNLILILIILNIPSLRELTSFDFSYLLTTSVKFWMVILLILGLFQFVAQGSVLNSYYIFGEFEYNSSNYHVKQDGFILKSLIPAYGIFSHPNIFGAFFLISGMYLHLVRKNSPYFVIFTIIGVLISGSLNILISLVLFFLFFYLKVSPKLLVITILFAFLTIQYLSIEYKKYEGDDSIYRRLYMTHLSNNHFLENPNDLIFGAGFYNYFERVAEKLYVYEIVRFFQPPHNFIYLLIWNYGLLFVIFVSYLFYLFYRKINFNFKIFMLILIFTSLFDHFLLTNHQLKMLLFLILPYSLNYEFGIKIK